MITLGIESSCDDTAVAVIRDSREVLSERVSSQITEHQRFGGVVPEFAARMHQEAILPLIKLVMDEARAKMSEYENIDLIAVTRGPGLMGSLMVGVLTACALGSAWDVPVIGVNHIEGHIFANFISDESLAPPFLSLVVSGGHTEVLLARGWGDYVILGATRDDAAGEAFDKAAKLLGLPYPGGAVIDSLSVKGNPEAFSFPVPLKNTDEVEFSFSGLKTALLWKLKQLPQGNAKTEIINDICASYQAAIVNSLMTKLELAAKKTGIKKVAISGGVAANSALRAAIQSKAGKWDVFIPPVAHCTDNAAMIAAAGTVAWKRGVRMNTIVPDPSLKL
ncbi:MAG: tRNA (adenosine(37)-N6)-threonylcarbamoyltransferase complex transferase subunit TsaD [Synergistaceae bacterium]|nr:tRNA (adenosine(37)-N6)-threonylcarbamoyltransferase complex transferase subunit TsaD [Synergistaceae bacterium]